MTESNATVLSFLIAPIVPSIALALSSPGLGGGLSADVETLAGLSVFFYFYAVVAVGLLGLPAFLLFRHHHLHNLWSATGVSSVLTCLVALALGSRPNGAIVQWAATMAVTALVGAATGSTFWAVRWCCMREHELRA
jgi:hypothetical protein